MPVRRSRLARAGAVGLAVTALLAGCSLSGVKKSIDRINASDSAYGDLQSFIQEQLTTKFHRSVRSVSCTPHVDEVVNDSSATMTCVVVFTDGSSYTTAGTVTNPNQDIDYATYDFSFTDPPPLP